MSSTKLHEGIVKQYSYCSALGAQFRGSIPTEFGNCSYRERCSAEKQATGSYGPVYQKEVPRC